MSAPHLCVHPVQHPTPPPPLTCLSPTPSCCPSSQTRYTIKYRHADAEIVLKVTDDVKVASPSLLPLHLPPRRPARPRPPPPLLPLPYACPLCQCLKFRSHLQSDLKYVDKINSAFIKLMTAKHPDTVALTEGSQEPSPRPNLPLTSSPHILLIPVPSPMCFRAE